MITLELVTLSGVKFSKDVWEVILPTENGQIAIFPHHMPLVSLLKPGVISIRSNQNDSDSAMEHFASHGGVIEIDDKRVRVLADEADHSDEVNEQQAQLALEHAKQLAKEAPDDKSLENALHEITIQQSRLRVAGLKKNRSKSRH